MVTLVLKKIAGRLAFVPPTSETERTALRKELDKCENKFNGYVSLTFSAPYPKRTSGIHSQNSCLHGYASCIADFTGDYPEVILNVCKKRAFRQGYPAKKDEFGNVLIGVDGEPIPESSAKVTTVECGYLIDELQILAGELGVILPPTMEELAEAKEKELLKAKGGDL